MKTPYPVQILAGILSCCFPQGYSQKKVHRRTGYGHNTEHSHSKHPSPTRPINKITVVLTSFHGDGYRGNTRILFERLCGHPSIRPVWLSRNRKLVEDLKNTFGDDRACLAHSLAGIRTLLNASAVFLTHGTSDYPFMRLPRHALIIQAYHGLPTKRGEYLRPGTDKPPGFFHRKILEYRFQPITHFLSSSPLVTKLFSSRFNLPAQKFLETGYPAYDALITRNISRLNSRQNSRRISRHCSPNFHHHTPRQFPRNIPHHTPRQFPHHIPRQFPHHIPRQNSGRFSHLISLRKAQEESPSAKPDAFTILWPDAPHADKLILYAPTFRRRTRTRWFPFDDFNMNDVTAFLEEKNALLAIRPHPNEEADIRKFVDMCPRIVGAGQKVIEDVPGLIPLVDAIITDYSAIYLEGLLLDIPAVFIPYDLDSYERGLPLPFEQISPGPAVFSQKEMLGALDKAIQRSDGYEQERTRVRDLYFSLLDGNATGRVLQFLEQSLNQRS